MPKTIKIEEAEVIKLIMNYLKKRNMLKSLFALELESQVHLEGFSKEMKFFRQLIFEGNFDEAETFLNQFQSKLGENYYRALFELKKQKYFELIDQKPDVGFLIRILKEIEQLVQADVYKNLCFFLTLKSINDHPEYIDWSVQKGRMDCFEAIRPQMKALGKGFANIGDTYHQDITQALQRLIMYELAVRDEFKQNTIQLSSLINMPNEIIEQQQKNIKIEFITNNDQSRVEKMNPVSQIFSSQSKTNRDDLLSQSLQIEKKPFHYDQSLLHDQEQDKFNNEIDTPKLKYLCIDELLRQTHNNPIVTRNSLVEEQKPKNKLAFHNRIKSNEGITPDSHQSKSEYHPEQQSLSYTSQKRGPLYSFRNDQQLQTANPTNRVKSKNSSEDHDKNIIIEKLYISDCLNEGSENESFTIEKQPKSSVFNYNFEEMIQAGHLSDSHPIRAAIFSSDGEYFAIGTNSKSLRIYSMKSLLTKENINGSHEIPILYEKRNHHLGSIYCIDWSRSGRLIATGSNDKIVKIIQAPDLNESKDSSFEGEEMRLIGHKGIVRSISFTHDETKLLSAGQVDTCIRVWDISTGQQIRTLEGHTQAIYCLQVGGDGSYQVSAGLDKTLRLWDLRQSKPIATILMSGYAEINYVSLSESANNYNLKNIMKGSKKGQNIQQSIGSQSLAALAHADGTVTVWDLPSQKCIQQITHHQADCRCVEFDPTARYLATASFDSTLTIYDFEQQKLLTSINNHEDRVVLCKWHPFYPFILSTSADSTGRIFAPKSFLTSLIKSFS